MQQQLWVVQSREGEEQTRQLVELRLLGLERPLLVASPRKEGYIVQLVLAQESVVPELVKKVMVAEFAAEVLPPVLRSRRGFVGALQELKELQSRIPSVLKSETDFRRIYVAVGGARLLVVQQPLPLL